MIRIPTDPPPPGYCKVRIKSDGEITRVLVVDELGVELELLGAVAVSWKHEKPGTSATACVRVIESEVELDAEHVAVSTAPA